MKEMTQWYPRDIEPVHIGKYECVGHMAGFSNNALCVLEWDGHVFLTDWPMVVYKWRGLTRKAYLEATGEPE